jgi:hypothetical protein
MNNSTKKIFKGALVVLVIFGMLAFYLLPFFSPSKSQRAPAIDTGVDFTPPVGNPSVKGPTAPPGVR